MKRLLATIFVTGFFATSLLASNNVFEKEVLIQSGKIITTESGIQTRLSVTVDNFRNLDVTLNKMQPMGCESVDPTFNNGEQYPCDPIMGWVPYAKVSASLTQSEYDSIIDMLVVLANAEFQSTDSQTTSVVNTPAFTSPMPIKTTLSILRDFDWRTRSFLGNMTSIQNNQNYSINAFLDAEKYNVVNDLLSEIYEITDTLIEDVILSTPNN